MRLLAASGQLGYGFTAEALRGALELGVDVIGCDAGSMDPGPYYLGAGVPYVSRSATRRDLGLLLSAAVEHEVPLIIGSAGGGGGRPHVAWTVELIREVAAERGLHFPLAVIQSEPDRDWLEAERAAGRIHPLGPIAPLQESDIRESTRIVAMMGVEPIQAALRAGARVVVAGRASDAALFAALPLMRGEDPGLVWHMAKIIECAGQVVEPRTGQDCVVGTLAPDHFLIEPGHPDKRCPRVRVAAHTLYENPSPHELREPGGTLWTDRATYTQHDERTVRVEGSRFEPARQYTVKLEGVRESGYRTVFIAGARDPGLVGGIEDFVARCRERVAAEAAMLDIAPDAYRLGIRLYGRDAVMGEREPVTEPAAHELGLLVDVVAADEEVSRAVLAKARYALLHTDFPGRQCISGNLAIPFSPSDIGLGMTYRFSVWHTLELDDPLAPFPIELTEV